MKFPAVVLGLALGAVVLPGIAGAQSIQPYACRVVSEQGAGVAGQFKVCVMSQGSPAYVAFDNTGVLWTYDGDWSLPNLTPYGVRWAATIGVTPDTVNVDAWNAALALPSQPGPPPPPIFDCSGTLSGNTVSTQCQQRPVPSAPTSDPWAIP